MSNGKWWQFEEMGEEEKRGQATALRQKYTGTVAPVQTVAPTGAEQLRYKYMGQPPTPTPQPQPAMGGGWFGKLLSPLAKGAEWWHEKVNVPLAAMATAPFTPGVPTRRGESWLEREMREYEAWQPRKYVKGATEFFADPIWLIGAGAPLAALGAKAGAIGPRAMKVLAPALKAERIATKALAAPIELPVRGAIKGVRALRPRGVARVFSLPKTDEIADVLFQRGFWRPKLEKVSKIPGAGGIIRAVDYSKLAQGPIERARVIRGVFDDMADAAGLGALATARAIRPPIKTIGGIVVDPAVKQVEMLPGKRSSMTFHDIIEYSQRYSMPQEYRAFVDEVRQVSKEMAGVLRKEGIFIQRKGEGDWEYLHRVVVSVKEDAGKQLALDIEAAIKADVGQLPRLAGESPYAYLARVMDAAAIGELNVSPKLEQLLGDVGKLADIGKIRQRLDKRRFYETVADGLKAGVKYADDPIQELSQQIRMSYGMIINKRLGEFFERGIAAQTKGEMVAAEMGIMPGTLQRNLRQAQRLVAVINRASRGEQIHGSTLRAIEGRFPEMGRTLRNLPRAVTPEERGLQKALAKAQQQLQKAQAAMTEYKVALVAEKEALKAEKAARAAAEMATAKRVAIPPDQKLRDAFEIMSDDMRYTMRQTIDTTRADIGRFLEDTAGELEGLRYALSENPGARFTELIPKAKGAEKELKYITPAQYKKVTGRSPLPSVVETVTERGRQFKRIRWELALDDLAKTLGYEERAIHEALQPDELLRNDIMRAVSQRQEIADLSALTKDAEVSLREIERMGGILDDVVRPAAEVPRPMAGMPEAGMQARFTAEGEVVLERFTPAGRAEVRQISMEDYGKLVEQRRAAGLEVPAEVRPTPAVAPEAEISRLETELMQAGKPIAEIQADATRRRLSDGQYLAELRKAVEALKPPTAPPPPPTPVGRKEILKQLVPQAKQEVIKAQARLAQAARIGERIVTPEMGQVVGVPGISGKVIPTQIINGKKVLGRDIATEIRRNFGWMPGGAAEDMVRKVGFIGGVMRMGKASMDLSVQLIQTMPLLGLDVFNHLAYPARFTLKELGIFQEAMKPTMMWTTSTYNSFRAAFDKAITWESKYWAKPENLRYLQEAAQRQALAQPSEYFEVYGQVLQKIGKLPVAGKPLGKVVRQTYGRAEAAFTAGRNVGANEYRKAYWRMAEVDGKLNEMCRASNLLTGVLSTKGMGISTMGRNLESGVVFFSPRFTRAVAAVFGHMFFNPTSWTGKQAMQSISGLMVGMYTFHTKAALALGQKPKLDPRPKSQGGDGAEWLSLKIGGRWIGLGGIGSDIRAAVGVVSQAFDDPDAVLKFSMESAAFRRLRAKFAPPTSAVYDYLAGRDYIGNPTRGGGLLPTKDTAFEVGKWGLPIWVEGMTEEGLSLPAALSEFFGGRTFPESTWNIYLSRLVELSGKDSIDQLSDYDRAELHKKHPELDELQDAARGEMERRGYSPVASEYWNRRAEAQAERLSKLEAAQAAYDKGKISGEDFRRVIQDTGRELGAQYRIVASNPRYADVIAELGQRKEGDFPVDAAYARYFEILFDPVLVDEMGVPRYDERDRSLKQLRAEVGEDAWAKVQERIDWSREIYPITVREYYQAVELLRPYWDIRDSILTRFPGLKALREQIDRLEQSPDPMDRLRARQMLQRSPQLKRIDEIIQQRQDTWRRQNPAGDAALVKFYGRSPIVMKQLIAR